MPSRGANSIDTQTGVTTQLTREPPIPRLGAMTPARERYLVVQPDTYWAVREGMESKALETWTATASRFHFNLDFRLNSQSLAACWRGEPCIGGRA